MGFAVLSNLARCIAGRILTGHFTNSHRAALAAVKRRLPRQGLGSGEMIDGIGQDHTPGAAVLCRAMAAAHPGDQVTVAVSRGAQQLAVQVPPGGLPGSGPSRQLSRAGPSPSGHHGKRAGPPSWLALMEAKRRTR